MKDVASRFLAPLLLLVVAIGCSSGQVAPRPIGVREPHAGDRSHAALGGQRPVRPIPDVITKPKAFRLSAPQGEAAAATGVGWKLANDAGATVSAGGATSLATSLPLLSARAAAHSAAMRSSSDIS